MLQISLIASVAALLLAGCASPPAATSARPKIKLFSGTTQTIFAAPANVGGTIAGCPGTYAGSVSYTKANPAWGWAPDTANTTVFTAADGGGRTDTKIYFQGKLGDNGCNLSTVTVPNPPTSTKYRFTIYFPNNVPTTNYPIILTGFLP